MPNKGTMNEIQGIEGDRRGDGYHVKMLGDSNCLYSMMRWQQFGESALWSVKVSCATVISLQKQVYHYSGQLFVIRYNSWLNYQKYVCVI
jgi:hypothetical protein